MTRAFNVWNTCQHCGQQTDAQTAFGRWMRNHAALDSGHGIVRTDTDHWILRYKTSTDGRQFQLLMLLEVKEHGAKPRDDQWDIFHFINVGMERQGKNRYGARTRLTFKAKSKCAGHLVEVRYMGYHLLRFQNTDPENSTWIKWDNHTVDKATLLGLLNLERNPDHPERWMIEFLRDRHRKEQTPFLNNFQVTFPEARIHPPPTVRPLLVPAITGGTGTDQHATSGQHQPYAHDRQQ